MSGLPAHASSGHMLSHPQHWHESHSVQACPLAPDMALLPAARDSTMACVPNDTPPHGLLHTAHAVVSAQSKSDTYWHLEPSDGRCQTLWLGVICEGSIYSTWRMTRQQLHCVSSEITTGWPVGLQYVVRIFFFLHFYIFPADSRHLPRTTRFLLNCNWIPNIVHLEDWCIALNVLCAVAFAL